MCLTPKRFAPSPATGESLRLLSKVAVMPELRISPVVGMGGASGVPLEGRYCLGMSTRQFRVKEEAIDEFVRFVAESVGFDVSLGLERCGFVPTFRKVLAGSSYRDDSAHPMDVATEISWIAYLVIAQRDGFVRPEGFWPKSIIVESVDGPFKTNAVRVSLWSEPATFEVASGIPIEVERFKHPDGKPTTYAQARWGLVNMFAIIEEEANRLIPLARAIANH